MNEANHTWAPNWRERLARNVRFLGFDCLTDLLATMPSSTYYDVANRISENVAAIQVVSVQFDEAKKLGKVREAAKDSLCRNLVEKLKEGWQNGSNPEFPAIHALACWSSGIQATGGCEHLQPTLRAIMIKLRDLPPPDGWIPRGSDDPIIEKVFDECWPNK